MKPYAELLEFNQPNPIRKEGFTRIRDSFDLVHRRDIGEQHPLIHDAERIMEFAGRWDYGENNARKLGEMSKIRVQPTQDPKHDVHWLPYDKEVPILQKYISMGHESMIEMGDATFFIECSRVVSHELVRHRLCSFQQESQRFVKYDSESADVLFYSPPELDKEDLVVWEDQNSLDAAMMGEEPYYESDEGISGKEAYGVVNQGALDLYRDLRKKGVAPQVARYVLPNAMRTRLIMKTNAREWRHILKLRTDKSVQPEMRELMLQIHDQLVDIFPNAMKGVLEGERAVR